MSCNWGGGMWEDEKLQYMMTMRIVTDPAICIFFHPLTLYLIIVTFKQQFTCHPRDKQRLSLFKTSGETGPSSILKPQSLFLTRESLLSFTRALLLGLSLHQAHRSVFLLKGPSCLIASAFSSILAWRIPWTEEPGGLQSMGLQRVGHDWATHTFF